jgi:predicted nucleic acid-binding protein
MHDVLTYRLLADLVLTIHFINLHIDPYLSNPSFLIDIKETLNHNVISRIEILSGARKGEDETIQSLFDIPTSVDVDLAIADGAGEYMRKFSRSHALSIGD